jgi:hypothetical protein
VAIAHCKSQNESQRDIRRSTTIQFHLQKRDLLAESELGQNPSERASEAVFFNAQKSETPRKQYLEEVWSVTEGN